MSKPFDRAKFNKVLSLAESDQDAEALAAVRKAASMARAAGLSLGEAVNGTDPDGGTVSTLRTMMMEAELATARREIAELRRKTSGAGDDATFQRGFEAGQRYGADRAAADLREQAFRRVRELEAELEAFRAPLDWLTLAERFYAKFRRGAKAPFAKGLMYRASVNKLMPADQAELRKFAATVERKVKRSKKPVEETAEA
ncbi:hypothetical protein D3877_17425 [Azospirillum cavernae]|uniref:Uncharacterized protein n=1 Tax=Azospirillum cavernae TaxID=2320860 RepID=A0A418VXI1_9PROT|nr:hypothetical protein [Azospirillum cavernae]RJF81878.1 hypothetical protein D3877_17425 [Azospirillum cavernae]